MDDTPRAWSPSRWAPAGWSPSEWSAARPWTGWVGTAGRLVVGGVWVVAGASKIGDLAASGRAVNAYQLLPYGFATVLGGVLPFLEIAIGLLLIVGLATRVAAIASVIFLTAFIIGISAAWARGLRIDCGCFGGGGNLAAADKPQYALELFRDIGLVALAGFLALFPRTRFSLDTWLLDGGTRK
jgi:uncharacterized membrane protein YphA (DoxX/SURF4 family)